MPTATLLLTIGIGAIFLALLLSLTAMGVFTNEARGVAKSLAVIEAFTAAPQALKDELDPGFRDRILNPTLDRLVGLGRKLTPSGHGERIRRKLELAGNPAGLTIDRVTSWKVLGLAGGFGAGVVISLLIGLGFFPLLAVVTLASYIGYMAPNMFLYQKAYDRTQKIQRALADALDLLTISVEAGLGFDAALAHVAKSTDGPLAEELARVLQEMQIGLGRSDALRALAERTTITELRGFVSAMVQADALGIPIGQVLRVQSSEIRVKRRQRAEELAQKVPVKILPPLIFCILPCLFIAVMGPAALTLLEAMSATK